MTVAAALGIVITADATGVGAVGFVITVTLMGFGFAFFVGNSLAQRIPGCLWDRMSLSREAARRCGVTQFNALLTRVGWNKLVFAARKDPVEGNGSRWNPRHMKAAAAGHAWGFLLHAVTAVWAAVTGGWVAVLLLLLIGIVGHLYPVLLQIYALSLLRRHDHRPSIA